MPEQGRTVIPAQMRARIDDVVALEGRDWNRGHPLELQRLGEAREVGGDGVEARLVEIDEVHLVDGERDLADAEQRQDAGVTPGLSEHPAARIDQQHGEIAIRRSRRHVARVLHVPWRIGDDELPPRRREIAIGDVDGDLLLALGLESVDEEREIERAARPRAGALLVLLGGFELVLVDQRRIVQQPADQRALAVVDAAAGEEAQQGAILLGGDPRRDPLGRALPLVADNAEPRHQK